MQQFAAAAFLLIDQLSTEGLLQFTEAFEGAGGEDESWAKSIVSPRVREFAFPSMGLIVTLSMQVPPMDLNKHDGTYTSADRS